MENRTRKKASPTIVCPVCSLSVRESEISVHLEQEVKNLETTNSIKDPSATPSSSSAANTTAGDEDRPASWSTYQSIKKNRQIRLKTKSRKRKPIENVICPVCNRITKENIHDHVEKCLNLSEKRQRTTLSSSDPGNGEDDDDMLSSSDSISVGGEGPWEPHEVYEWAGQTRIRASTMLPGGGYASVGISGNCTTITPADTDENLDVDGEEVVYGPPQYHERDVIPPPQSQDADKYLRSLIAGESAPSASTTPTNGVGPDKQETAYDSSSSPLGMQGQILESLKAKLKDYEQCSSRDKIKCQICMDDYKNPCVSVCCWHVYCEDCWLRTLGSRKLCPKCNSITSAPDLRRIYL